MIQNFSILKASEGGMSQKYAIQLLKDAGLKARPGHTIYVGHTGIEVEGTKRQIDKASKILFG